MTAREGFIFAATGEQFVTMARRAARSLREVMPDTKIDLFSAQPLDDDVFDQVHLLERDWHRPKMEALRRSRFERTIYLDADVMVLADISEIFALLDRFDMAAAFGTHRSPVMSPRDGVVPRAFPVVNSGVMAVRVCREVVQFMQDWEADMDKHREKIDQPALRRMLFQTDLRFTGLPMEYNVKDLSMLNNWSETRGAPRVLHQSRLSEMVHADPSVPYEIEDLLPGNKADRVRALLKTDWDLGGVKGKYLAPLKRKLRNAIAQRKPGGPDR